MSGCATPPQENTCLLSCLSHFTTVIKINFQIFITYWVRLSTYLLKMKKKTKANSVLMKVTGEVFFSFCHVQWRVPQADLTLEFFSVIMTLHRKLKYAKLA
jgi:hypothetical protein